jgi:hypothetical protein
LFPDPRRRRCFGGKILSQGFLFLGSYSSTAFL